MLAVVAGSSRESKNKVNKHRTQKAHALRSNHSGHHHSYTQMSLTHFCLSSHVCNKTYECTRKHRPLQHTHTHQTKLCKQPELGEQTVSRFLPWKENMQVPSNPWDPSRPNDTENYYDLPGKASVDAVSLSTAINCDSPQNQKHVSEP